MKKSLLLSAALAVLVLPMPVATVSAQVDASQANTRAARRAREAKQNGTPAATQLYPKASRESPKQVGNPKLSKQIEALFALQGQDGDEDNVIAKADAIIADARSNAFDKSSASYLGGSAWLGKSEKDYANPIRYYQQAIDGNGLDNNLHYQAMMQVAQLLEANDKHKEALVYIDRFLAETQSADTRAIGIKNQILMGLGKPELAIAFLEKQAAAKPDDKKLQMTLASLYQEAGQEAKTLAIFDRLHKGGMLTESNDYDVAWRLLAGSDNRQKEALALVEEGFQKGILVPNHDAYAFQAQTYYAEGDLEKAIAAWTKGAPLGKTGQTFLNLSQALLDKERFAEAKTAAQQALSRGVKKQGAAWQVIAQSEAGAGNKAGAVAAYKETAKYPETKKWAESELRQASGK